MNIVIRIDRVHPDVEEKVEWDPDLSDTGKIHQKAERITFKENTLSLKEAYKVCAYPARWPILSPSLFGVS